MAAAAPSSVLTAWTGTLLRALAARGVDVDALVAEVGLDPSVTTDPERRIPLATSRRLWARAVELTGDDAFGIEVSRYATAGSFHGLGQAFMASPTLRGALERAARFSRVTADRSRVSTAVEGGMFLWVNGWADDTDLPAPAAVVATMAAVVRAARAMHGRDLAPVRVDVAHPVPANRERYAGFFRCPVRFDAPEFVLGFARADVDRPVPGGHDRLASAAESALVAYLDTLDGDDEVRDRVRAVLVDAVAAGEPDAGAVAAELAMSRRTLQRRLAEEGTTFRAVVAETRCELASSLLREPGASVTEVGRRVGFSETAAFSRAFRRWTGVSPRAYRESGSASGSLTGLAMRSRLPSGSSSAISRRP